MIEDEGAELSWASMQGLGSTVLIKEEVVEAKGLSQATVTNFLLF